MIRRSQDSSFVAEAASEQPAPMGHVAIHDRVIEILDPLPRGALLDVPAGQGALALRLSAAGFGVRCCDLYPEIFKLREVEIKHGDLCGTLPYGSGAFDYVVCVEGLEHVENPHQAIREFRRLVKPGGRLIVSVPNILNIEERVKWLLHGYTSHFKPISREAASKLREQSGGLEETALHIHPIGYSELRFLLEKNGFEIARIYRDKPKANAWLYLPLTAIIRLIALMTPRRKKQERWTRELQSKEVLLGGNTLLAEAVKL